MKSDTVATRRANLKAWIDKNGTPSVERSYFSQLVNGECSFGERAARRIESDYRMGHLFLDKQLPPEAEEQAPTDVLDEDSTALARVNRRELRLLTLYRESTERGKLLIEMSAKASEKDSLAVVGRHKAK